VVAPASRKAESPANPEDVQGFSVGELARRCTHETSQYFNRRPHDPRFCLELFRRAITEADQTAWEAVFIQYRPLVTGWVVRHPAFHRCREEEPYFVNRAFEKFWSALAGREVAGVGDLPGVLRYLQMCVHSAVVDHLRQERPALQAYDSEPDGDSGTIREPSAPDGEIERVEREEFWRLIDRKLRSRKDKQVIYASYVLGLKPQEVCSVFHKTFTTPADVYLAKQNVLSRLRRDPELRQLLGIDD
jgi:DNA-directed RNA polymerase specialized sigma24 family protein